MWWEKTEKWWVVISLDLHSPGGGTRQTGPCVLSTRLSHDLASPGSYVKFFGSFLCFFGGDVLSFQPLPSCLYLLLPSLLFHNNQVNNIDEKTHFTFLSLSALILYADVWLLLLLFHVILTTIFFWDLCYCPCFRGGEPEPKEGT